MKLKKIILLLLISVFLLNCSEDGDPSVSSLDESKLYSLKLSFPADTVNMFIYTSMEPFVNALYIDENDVVVRNVGLLQTLSDESVIKDSLNYQHSSSEVTWHISNPDVLSEENGVITCNGVGSSLLFAQKNEVYSDTATVVVKYDPDTPEISFVSSTNRVIFKSNTNINGKVEKDKYSQYPKISYSINNENYDHTLPSITNNLFSINTGILEEGESIIHIKAASTIDGSKFSSYQNEIYYLNLPKSSAEPLVNGSWEVVADHDMNWRMEYNSQEDILYAIGSITMELPTVGEVELCTFTAKFNSEGVLGGDLIISQSIGDIFDLEGNIEGNILNINRIAGVFSGTLRDKAKVLPDLPFEREFKVVKSL